ncbi:NBR1 autophagy cargo receptor a [Aplochiton taeniatus]
MGLPVTIKVNFRGNVKRFVAPDLDKSEWESVEAWIKASFGISHFQVKYFDEDNEEISINSQEEYEEAVKSAEKQGNQLHMNVYKMKGQPCGVSLKAEVKELKGDLRPAPPYPSRVKTVDKGTQVTPEREAVAVKDSKGTKPDDEPPPVWFRSYMDKFKDEVVKEVVERMCNDFSGQCCTFKAHPGPLETPGAGGGATGSKAASMAARASCPHGSIGYTPNCSSCNKRTSEGAYKCSVCPSCILCELCRHSHDPSHNLVRTKTPLSIPEHGMSGELRFPRREDRTVRKAERQRLKAERRQLKAEVKEIKKKLRLEKRGPQWSGLTTSGRSIMTATASASTQAPALAPEPSPEPGPGPGPSQAQAPAPASAPDPQASSPEGPEVSHTTLVPTMAALFLDENLPDGTRLEPGTKFIKYWKMRNSGTISWTSETKLKFMWGNLGLASEEKREVTVPLLQPGQVGVVSVAFVAPVMEGTYTSHWRLAHCGGQFGPRVWCSIVVDPATSRNNYGHQNKPLANNVNLFLQKDKVQPSGKEDRSSSSRDTGTDTAADSPREFYFPSVDLLTAQDLLSFELLDINIVQELEKVPNNTPADLTPCMSPLPHGAPAAEKPSPESTREDTRIQGVKNFFGVKSRLQSELSDPPPPEEGDEDISGAQFLCETVIRSLTLEEAPDHKPLRRVQYRKPKAFTLVARGSGFGSKRSVEQKGRVPGLDTEDLVLRVESSAHAPVLPDITLQEEQQQQQQQQQQEEDDKKEEEEEEEEEEGNDWDEVSSQASSVSSCDDYIIVLPDCFDTSRPLGDSMYSSALSQTGETVAAEEEPEPDSEPEELGRATPEGERQEGSEVAVAAPSPPPVRSTVNQLLCASQTLDAVPLTPEVAPPPQASLFPPPVVYSPRSEALYLAEDPSPPVSRSYEPRHPGVKLNISGLSRSAGSASAFETYNPRPCNTLQTRGQGGITEGLVKGALSVAASAYKALFTGPSCSTQRGIDPAAFQDPSIMTVLLEMGFRDQCLNQRLLRKHRYNLLHTVNDLVLMAEAKENEGAVAHY